MPCFRLRLVLAATLAGVPLSVPVRAADADAGAAVFRAQCKVCHSVERGGEALAGPSLFGVVGRHASAVPDFRYSPANRRADLTFDEPTLDRYISNPQAMIPGTVMAYPGLKDSTRRSDLIAFLATQK
jgi:cytochrome c